MAIKSASVWVKVGDSTKKPDAPQNAVLSTTLVPNPGSSNARLKYDAATVPSGGTAVTGYTAYNNGSFLGSLGNTLEPTLTGLSPSTAYSITVTATNADGEGPPSTAVTFTTTAGAAAPAAPTGLTQVHGSTTATLSWDSVAGMAYRVYVGSDTSPRATVAAGSAATATIASLSPSTSYTITVKAYDGTLESTTGASVTFTTDAVVTTGFPTLTAEQVRGVFGTRVFPLYDNKTGGEFVSTNTSRKTAARNLLTDLKPGFITHKLAPSMPADVIEFIQTMSRTYGIKSVLTVGEPHTPISAAEYTSMMNYLKNQFAGDVLMVSNWNEANNVRPATANVSVTRKSLTSNVATLTLGSVPGSAHVGHGVRITNVGAPFDGTFTITDISGNTISYKKTAGNVAGVAASGSAALPILPPDWKQQVGDVQDELWTRINGSASTSVNSVLTAAGKAPIQVGGPALWSGDIPSAMDDWRALAPFIEGKLNAHNFHLYQRGLDPNGVNIGTAQGSTELDVWIDLLGGLLGNDLPFWLSEWGYLSAPNYSGGAANVLIGTAAIYDQKMILEWALRQATGAVTEAHCGQFEFVNDPDHSQASRESWLGLVAVDTSVAEDVSSLLWTGRATYTAIKDNLMALTGGSSGAASVSVAVSGSNPVQSLAIKHSGGVKVALWRRGRIESATGVAQELSPQNVSVTVTKVNGTTTTVNVGRAPVYVDA